MRPKKYKIKILLKQLKRIYTLILKKIYRKSDKTFEVCMTEIYKKNQKNHRLRFYAIRIQGGVKQIQQNIEISIT